MPVLGQESYMVIGEENTWGTQIATIGNMLPKIYEVRSNGLQKVTTPINPNRLTGDPSPLKQITGMISCGGEVVLELSADSMLPWLKHLSMDAFVTPAANAQAEVRASAAYTDGTAFSLDNAPNGQLPETIPSGLLEFNFATSTGTGTILITGLDHNGLRITETLTSVNFAGSAPQATSAKYYSTGVQCTTTGATPGTLQMDADPNSYKTTMTLASNLLVGLTAEVVKGTDAVKIPNTYFGLLLSQGVLTLGDVVTLAITMIGKDADLRRAVDGTTTASSLAGLIRPSQDVIPNWGMALEVAGTVREVSSLSFDFNNALDFKATSFAESINFPKPVRRDRRSLTVNATIDYDDTQDFDALYGTALASKVRAVSKPIGGRYTRYVFDLPTSELVSFTDPTVDGPEEITQDVSIRGYVGALGNDEMSIEIISGDSTL